MSGCPFCSGETKLTGEGGIPRRVCEECRALWFEVATLTRVVQGREVEELVERAEGRPGHCKKCRADLWPGMKQCTHCETKAARCPECGHAPLAVVELVGVPVDVCPRGHGVGLDPWELSLLRGKLQGVEAPDGRLLDSDEPVLDAEDLVCAGCDRDLKPKTAYRAEDKLWCASCAPRGSSPVRARLTPYNSVEDDPLETDMDREWQMSEEERSRRDTEAFFLRFFNFLFAGRK